MGNFVSYNFQVAIVLIGLYLAYKWLMSSTTFYSLNRVAIITILLFSFAIPLIIPFISIEASSSESNEIGLPITEISASNGIEANQSHINPWLMMVYVYYAGVAVAMATTLVSIARLHIIIKAGKISTHERYLLCISEKAPGPFSWCNIIVLRPSDCDKDKTLVLTHETEHLRLHHWIDLALAQIVCILQWFNPAAWLTTRELKNVHEYQVDDAVARENRMDYQLMLIKKTVGSSFPTFTDSLNHSQLKTRLTMMMKAKSKSSRRMALLALPTFAAIAACVITLPAVANICSNFSSAMSDNDSSRKISVSAANSQSAARNEIAVHSEKEGSSSEVTAASSPTKNAESINETVGLTVVQKAEGSKIAYFLNDKPFDGDINSIDAATISSMRVVKDDPEYPAGKIMIYTNGSSQPKDVRIATEKIAEFKGGTKALLEFLKENISYPENAPKDDKQYRVIVRFTIDAQGNVQDAEVLRGKEPFHQEALSAVMKTSGQWIPAEKDGKPIATKFTLPVNFVAK